MKNKIFNITISILLAFLLMFSGACSKTNDEPESDVGAVTYGYETGIDYGADAIEFVKDGKTDYVILINASCSESVLSVAYELQNYIKQVSGASVNIVQAVTNGQHFISVGDTEQFKASGIDVSEIKNDGYVLKTVEKDIFVASNSDKGIMFGVYTFIERFLGVRWLSEVYTHIPNNDNISVYPCDIKEEPEFPLRHWLNGSVALGSNKTTVAFFNHMKFDIGNWYNPGQQYHNATDYDEQGKRGSGWVNKSDFCECGNPEHEGKTLKETHPEFFTDFTRTSKHYDLCFTNGIDEEGNLKEGYSATYHIVRKLKKILSEDTEQIYTNFQIGHMDASGVVCLCDTCKDRIAKYKYSGVEIIFINCIEREINSWLYETQGRKVDFTIFAYHDSEDPPVKENEDGSFELLSPLCKANEHIAPRLALIDVDQAYSVVDERQNFEYYEKVFKGWNLVADQLMIWDYVVEFYDKLFYFPNLTYLKDNYKYYKEMNVSYVMGEASSEGYWHTYMRMYVASRLFWNLNWDVDYLMNEFIELYFGPGADDVKEFVFTLDNFYEELREDASLHMPVVTSKSMFISTDTYSVPFVKKLLTISENAINSIETCDTISNKEKVEYRLHAQNVKLQPMRMILKNYTAFYTPETQTEYLLEFLDLCEATGVVKEFASLRENI